MVMSDAATIAREAGQMWSLRSGLVDQAAQSSDAPNLAADLLADAEQASRVAARAALVAIALQLTGAEEETCRVCGCTEDAACEGGCHWVAAGLCSACNDPAKLVLGKVRALVDRSVTPAQLAAICDKVLTDYQNGTDAQ